MKRFSKIITIATILLISSLLCFSCDSEKELLKFATENNCILNGSLTGKNMHFLGTWTVKDNSGHSHLYEDVVAEFAGLKNVAIYIHHGGFTTEVESREIKFPSFDYEGNGNSIKITPNKEFIPQILKKNTQGGGMSYQDAPDFKILKGCSITINDINCQITFKTVKDTSISFKGKMVEKF